MVWLKIIHHSIRELLFEKFRSITINSHIAPAFHSILWKLPTCLACKFYHSGDFLSLRTALVPRFQSLSSFFLITTSWLPPSNTLGSWWPLVPQPFFSLSLPTSVGPPASHFTSTLAGSPFHPLPFRWVGLHSPTSLFSHQLLYTARVTRETLWDHYDSMLFHLNQDFAISIWVVC